MQENRGILLFLPFCLVDMEEYGISKEVVRAVAGAQWWHEMHEW